MKLYCLFRASFSIFIQTTSMEDPRSAAFRMKIFDWLQERVVTKGDVLIDGQIVSLLGPQGIFKPNIINYFPISITTSPNSSYTDNIFDKTITYKCNSSLNFYAAIVPYNMSFLI